MKSAAVLLNLAALAFAQTPAKPDNLARRASKQCVMLVYPGENHSLAVKANQQDYHRRILEWFGYHLKGDAPPEWITKGVTVLDREKELKKTKKETASGTP